VTAAADGSSSVSDARSNEGQQLHKTVAARCSSLGSQCQPRQVAAAAAVLRRATATSYSSIFLRLQTTAADTNGSRWHRWQMTVVAAGDFQGCTDIWLYLRRTGTTHPRIRYQCQQLRLTAAANGSSTNKKQLQAAATADADSGRWQQLQATAAADGSNLMTGARKCERQKVHVMAAAAAVKIQQSQTTTDAAAAAADGSRCRCPQLRMTAAPGGSSGWPQLQITAAAADAFQGWAQKGPNLQGTETVHPKIPRGTETVHPRG
jgi:hypothetical protein